MGYLIRVIIITLAVMTGAKAAISAGCTARVARPPVCSTVSAKKVGVSVILDGKETGANIDLWCNQLDLKPPNRSEPHGYYKAACQLGEEM